MQLPNYEHFFVFFFRKSIQNSIHTLYVYSKRQYKFETQGYSQQIWIECKTWNSNALLDLIVTSTNEEDSAMMFCLAYLLAFTTSGLLTLMACYKTIYKFIRSWKTSIWKIKNRCVKKTIFGPQELWRSRWRIR